MIDFILQRPWESLAVMLGLAYVVLAAREHLACWPCALASTGIYTLLFWDVNLLMESALQVFYMAMAVYGWHQWRHGGADANLDKSDSQVEGDNPDKGASLAISTWPLRHHLIAISLVLAATIISGTLLAGTDQHLRYVDSFTTWGAIVTTYMVTRKILENWLYWVIIDLLSIYLYIDRALYLTVALYALYVVIALYGYRQWLAHYRIQSSAKRQGPG